MAFLLLFLSAVFNVQALQPETIKKEMFYSQNVSFKTPAFSSDPSRLKPINPKNILPSNISNNPLIVVHTSSFFDENFQAKTGLDELTGKYREKKHQVIYLLHDQSEQGYKEFYPSMRNPDYEIFSAGGEHNLALKHKEVTIAGGFFGSYDGARGCHALAVRDAIRMHYELSKEEFTVNMPLNAIYYYEEDLSFIEKIKKLDPKKNSQDEIKKVFENFSGMFFLTDNFESSSPEALGFAHPFFSPETNPSYRPGDFVDNNLYSFNLYFDNILVETFGSGEKKVHLKLWRKL